MVVDDLDRRLIRCLQDNPRASYATIARITGVSETTVRRRVEYLISSGVIVTAVLPDLHMLGYRTSAVVGLKTDLDQAHAIGDKITGFPEVTFVAWTTGHFDVVFVVAAETLDDLMKFLAERVAPMKGVRDVEPMVMPRMLKGMRSWRIPLDPSRGGDTVDLFGEDKTGDGQVRSASKRARSRETA